ncbi:MAG: hypothetical protein Kow0031_15440 [Anaerolineae bacterium]
MKFFKAVVLALLTVALLAGWQASLLPAAAQQEPQAEVVTAALNMRTGPGTDFEILAVAMQGDTFAITGTNADQSWLQVNRPDGTSAWISGWQDYVQVTGSLADVTVARPSAAPSGSPAAATPGGGKLALMTNSGSDIYLINADGSNLRLLTQGGIDPALSPDGTQVAFARWGLTEGIFLMNVDGSNERQIHPATQPKSPSWSPDGTQLVFNMQRGGRLNTVQECTVSSSKDDPNLPPDAFDVRRSTIVDGEKYEFCYSLPPRPWWQLRQLNLATGEFRDVNSDAGSFGPAWDPRESWRVVYSGDVNLVQLDLNRDEKFTLQPGSADRTPAFSPDGAQLAVATDQSNGQYAIHVINMDTAERTALATQGSNVSPTWSPDGSQIAFLSNRDGAWNVYVMNADGSSQRPMFAPGTLDGLTFTFDGVDERMLSWSK